MRRFAPRLTAALLTFALGVLIATMRTDLRFRERLWSLYRPSSPITRDAGARKCFEDWDAADPNRPLGWDLTYFSVVTKMRICPYELWAKCEQWVKPAPPIHEHIFGWQGDPIISSIEIELPDGHADMAALWFIRTKDHAYYWGFYPFDTDYSGGKHSIPTQDYDTVFEKISCWQQSEPEQKKFGAHGYVGFLSLYEKGKSRQMLLTADDFIAGGKDPGDYDTRLGPFRKLLEPLIAPLRKRRREPTQGK